MLVPSSVRNVYKSYQILLVLKYTYLSISMFKAVCSPYQYLGRGTKWSHCSLLMAYVVPSFVLAIVFNIPRYTQGRMQEYCSQYTQLYTVADTDR